jgi:hypothetical protein
MVYAAGVMGSETRYTNERCQLIHVRQLLAVCTTNAQKTNQREMLCQRQWCYEYESPPVKTTAYVALI